MARRLVIFFLTFFLLAKAPATPLAVSESAIDMLSQLFPHRKRSVLELILRRCDLDLLKAIEQCRPSPSAFKPPAIQVLTSSITQTSIAY